MWSPLKCYHLFIIVVSVFPAKGSTKHADFASAVAIKGSCPDMCPELERYTREFQRRLSVYEIVPGTDGVCLLWLVGQLNVHW